MKLIKLPFQLFCLLLISHCVFAQFTATDLATLNAGIVGYNNAAAGSTTTISVQSDITLSSSSITSINPINPNTKLIIQTPSSALNYTIDGTSSSTLFNVQGNADVTFKNLNIVKGFLGGLKVISSTAVITIDRCRFWNNNNSSGGGGIYNEGTMTITNSCIDNNTSSLQGGGIHVNGTGSLAMSYSTVSGNTVNTTGNGGGILHMSTGAISINHCTIAFNRILGSGGNGGGVHINIASAKSLTYSIIVDNSSPFLRNISTDATLNVQGSLINNPAPFTQADCYDVSRFTGTILSPSTGATTFIYSSLALNGGVTPTHALKGSFTQTNVINGDNTITTGTDQRDMPIKGDADIGAYEFGTFWVTTNVDETIDNSTYSLREALTDANGGVGLPDTTTTGGIPYREIKFRIPSVSPLCTLFTALPVVDKAMIIDGNTQLAYPSSTKVVLSGIGSFNGFSINPSAARTQVYGLVFRNFTTGIAIDANNVVIGDYVSSPSVIDRRNVLQRCGAGVIINGNFAKINANYFGLQENGLDATSANGTGYDIQIGGSTTNIIGTTIGEFAKGNYLAAKNGGIMFSGSSPLMSSTTIQYNNIGTDITSIAVIDGGSTVGIHTNGNVNILNINNNLIVNKGNAGGIGIFLNDDSKNVTIKDNQIGFSYSGATIVPLATYNGIQIRGGGNSSNITIKTNTIAGNTSNNIFIENGIYATNAITIDNNKIGIANNSTEDIVPGNGNGIQSQASGSANLCLNITSNTIGGCTNAININQPAAPTPTASLQPFNITNNIIGLKSNTLTSAANNNGISIIGDSSFPLFQACSITSNTVCNSASIGVQLDNIKGASHIITGNLIGTNAVGDTGLGNVTGIYLANSCTNLTIGGASVSTANVIASNTKGIVIDADNTILQFNYIGTNAAEAANIGNTTSGIVINGTANSINDNIVSGNGFGAAGNAAVVVNGNNNILKKNLIGLNATGTSLIRNNNGLLVSTGITGTIIEDNIISGTNTSGGDAVTLRGIPSSFKRNNIGTDKNGNDLGLGAGVFAIGGRGILIESLNPSTPLSIEDNAVNSCNNTGIRVDNSANIIIQNNRVGTNNAGTSIGGTANGIGVSVVNGTFTNTIITNNIISNNGVGISLDRPATITANKIGLDAIGTAAIPNTTGIEIGSGLSGITIGGSTTADGNSFAATFIGILANSSCVIDNNKFGTTHDGTAALSNFGNLTLPQPTFSAQAISLTAGSCTVQNNIICGARNNVNTSILGNTLIGSAEGILIAAGDMDINSNKIGITLNNIPIPNDIGIRTQGTVNNCSIGNNSTDGNVISNNKNAAIYLAHNSTSLIGINGTKIGTSIDGLALSNQQTQVGIAGEVNAKTAIDNNNLINNTTVAAISLLSTTPPLNQIKNTIIGNLPTTPLNTQAGISVVAGSTIEFNDIKNGEGVGVLLLGSFNTLSFNSIHNNKRQGVNITNGDNNRINQCSIYSNGSIANSFTEKGIEINIGTAQQGNAGQIAPVLQSVIVTGSTVTSTVIVNIPVAGDYFLQFFKTTPATANNDINQVEGEIYLGTVNQTFTSTGTQTITVSFTLLPATTVDNTDFVTATITSAISTPTTISNSSEFSNALTPCPNKIVAITLANIDINCTGTTADVLIQYEDLQNPPVVGDLFDVDIDGNGTFDFTNIPLETGNIIRLKTMSGGTTFSNTKVKPASGSCVTPAFANTVTVPASRIPSPIITNVQAIQPTSCNPNNGQLIVTLGNGTAGETYEVSTVGTTFGAGNFQNLVLSTNRTLTITGFKGGDRITPAVVVYRRSLSCTSNAFPFTFNYITPINNIDSTLNIVADVDEISPNFPTNIVVERTQDSIAYTLFNLRTGRQIGLEQIGKANTSVTFVTDTLFTNTDFAVYARSIRTGCSIKLAKTVTVKVISGILAEELDVLREVYTSTIGDNWLIKWDFTKDISTFYGVRVFGGRVYDIKLGGNNLAGTLTTRVNTLKRLAILEINNNQLDFGSVEPFVGQKYSFRYNVQAKINRSIDTAVYEKANLQLNVTTAGNFNRYQWQKDGVNVGSISSSPTLVLSPLKTTDAGTYTCFVTNTIGTALTLERRTIRLKVLKYPSTLDSLLLVRLNDALGGNNWKNKWDRTKPVSQWYGIEMDGDKVISLNLANNNLVGTIPDIIPTSNNILSDLIYLNLSGNLISGALPKTLGNLTKLQYLDVSKNNLQGEVIAELGNLRASKTLLLSFNNFSTIHPNISTLAVLENLFVNNNQLKELPTALSGLRALQKFDASYNLLQQFPANFSTWANLTYLALSNNQITTLPNNWNSFANLQELYLQVNQLKDLPNTFTALRNLKTLYLHSNALDFADLEPLTVLPVLNTDGAVYEPQAKVGTAQEVVFALDQVISLSQTINGTANTYEWWKDDRKIAGIAANQLNYLKYTVTFEDAGTYKLVIRNNIARRLALISQDIVVKVACGTSSSVQVGIAGNLQYCEGETYNTTLTAQLNAIKPIAYQWFRNNTRLAGEETATLKPVLEGSYTVQVRGEDGCIFISKAITFTTSPKPVATLRNVGDSLIVNILAKRGAEKIVWYRNGEQIANASGRTYKATTAGKYYAVIADTTICQAKTQELNITITGVEEDLAKNLQLYPNPANDKIVLQTTLVVEKLVLQNNLGQTLPITWVKDADKYSIDLKDLPTGVYYLSIYHSKGKIQQKLHKE